MMERGASAVQNQRVTDIRRICMEKEMGRVLLTRRIRREWDKGVLPAGGSGGDGNLVISKKNRPCRINSPESIDFSGWCSYNLPAETDAALHAESCI